MKCPVCEKEGQESTVYVGTSTRTHDCLTYYDGNDYLHRHDSNTTDS